MSSFQNPADVPLPVPPARRRHAAAHRAPTPSTPDLFGSAPATPVRLDRRPVAPMPVDRVLPDPRPPVVPSSEAPAVAAAGLTKVFGTGPTSVKALDGIDLTVPGGRFTAIMGASGSGKSTLLHCLAGLESPTAGRVWLGGTDITGLNDNALTILRRERVGFVFQSFNLLPTLTAEQNMRLPLDLAGRRPDRDWWDFVVHTLGLGDRLQHRPGEMSGGQQQRVAIGRAMLSRPAVIVADEPTGNLDSRTGAEVLDLLGEWARESSQTVLMVTHDPLAACRADEVVILADGRIRGMVTDPEPDRLLAALAGRVG